MIEAYDDISDGQRTFSNEGAPARQQGGEEYQILNPVTFEHIESIYPVQLSSEQV